MATITVELDDEQIFDAVQELSRSERVDLAREILINDDEDLEDDVLSELSDQKAIALLKERLDGWVKEPLDTDMIRAVLEHALDAARKVKLLVEEQPIMIATASKEAA
jgi:hypothetical protein